jgi:hypothetical protein
MVICMRTTLDLNEQLVRSAKKLAAERGTSLTAIIEDALREKLSRPKPEAAGKRRVLHTFKGNGLQPGVELGSTAALLDLLDHDAAP